jgi:tetratricopeptide (TPR) repeat protein
VVALLPELDKTYAGHAVVQWGIGQRHLADGRSSDALRCWKQWIALSPDMEAYRKLAEAYLAGGDEERWLETMEQTLEQEDTSLFHTRVRVDIANYYMGKKEFKRAEPYALAAAKSGAAWALHCAAECERGLNKWDEANRFYRAAALGYGQPAFTWYFTCRATGKMDRAAAESAVRDYLRDSGPGTRASELFRAGRFHLLEGDTKEAGMLFGRATLEDRTDMSFLFAALAADAEKDATVRDLALSRTGELDPDKNPLHWFGPEIRKWSAAGAAPNSSVVEAALKRLAAGPRADAEFLVGWFLANRGQRDRALVHWKRCAEAEAGLVWVKTHARASLETVPEGGPAKSP